MADNKNYYYLRLKEHFFDGDELIILESMPNGYLYSNILLKLYLKSLKRNGKLALSETIPYSKEVLAKVIRHEKQTVEDALKIFQELGLVEILDNGTIFINDIQNYIGKSTTEADRQREYQRQIQEEKEVCKKSNKKSNKKSTPEIEIELDTETELNPENKGIGKVTSQSIVDLFNSICVSYQKVTKLSEARKKAIKARLKDYTIEDFQQLFMAAEESDFLKGKNDRGWMANFDWLIKDANMVKVLDGNYSQKGSGSNGERGSSSYGHVKTGTELMEEIRAAAEIRGESYESPCVDNIFK